MLRELKIGGGGFLLPAEEDRFRRMLERHGKGFTLSPGEIGCVDLMIVDPMVIFTVPHVPWNLRLVSMPRAHIPKLTELLKQKIEMGVLEPSSAPTRIGDLPCQRRTARYTSFKTWSRSTK